MEFITIVHPDQQDSPRLRRQAHSHAARTAHARARKARVASHNAQQSKTDNKTDKKKKGAAPSQYGPDMPSAHSVHVHTSLQALPVMTLFEAVPVSLPGRFEHEPLATFRRTLTAREHFLLDYCTSHLTPWQ